MAAKLDREKYEQLKTEFAHQEKVDSEKLALMAELSKLSEKRFALRENKGSQELKDVLEQMNVIRRKLNELC
ncbi:MAG: hypothetical protein VW879_15465 [Opitutae bacterium]